MTSRSRPLVLAAALMLALPGAPPRAEDAGALAFTRGAGLEGRIGGADGPRLRGAGPTCAGCHGRDARGGTEGAVPAPAIAWPVLARPTASRPAYDAAAFERLLSGGVDPAGRRISSIMPRYAAAPGTVAALAGYLRRLDALETEGLGPDRIAIRLPPDPGTAEAARAAIAAFNAGGGAYGRRIVVGEPAFLDLGEAMARLRPRLGAAEEARVAAEIAKDPGLARLPDAARGAALIGRLTEFGPEIRAVLSGGARVLMVGPGPEALEWALRAGAGANAAEDHAAATEALLTLRAAGRHPGRTRIERAISEADLSPVPTVYLSDPTSPGPGPASAP